MFVVQRFRLGPKYLQASKRLLSQEFRDVLHTRLEPPAGINSSHLQYAVVSKNLNALNLDLFVNNLSPNEDRRSAVLDLLTHIRASHLANTCLESTNFAAVAHLLDNSSIQEVVPVLLDRPQYGIFLNNFTGFTVLEALHAEKEYELAMPLALKMVLLDELDSKFIKTFCLKSILVALQKELTAEPVVEEEPKKPAGKKQEKKIRLRFLRNPLEIDPKDDMGKAFLKVASTTLSGEAKDNAIILGLVLRKKYKDLSNLLGSVKSAINTDVFKISKHLLASDNNADLSQKLEAVAAQQKTSKSLEEHIESLLAQHLEQEEHVLCEQQKQLFTQWQQVRNETKQRIEEEISIRERKQNIQKITNELDTKRQLLWFFEDEDKLDLEIYNKRVFYPKRWFGKKKKPRVVDEHYVPPQIRKIN